MRLLEHEGKALFAECGIPVPQGFLAWGPEEAVRASRRLGFPVMVKAQVASGGRGRGGAIRQAADEATVLRSTSELLAMSIHGLPVESVWIEEYCAHQQELYLSYYLDYASETLWLLFSPHGGVDVETIPSREVLRLPVELRAGPRWDSMRRFLTGQGLSSVASAILETARRLYQCTRSSDLILAEINPLFVLDGARLIAGDARVEMDDNSLFRHRWAAESKGRRRNKTDRELRAEELGLNGFVELDGEIGILASGAGLGMASMDLLESAGLRPANFLETGGRISAGLIEGALRLVLDQSRVRGVLVNLYGGINPMIEAAQGLVAAASACRPSVPIVVKLLGNEQEEAWNLLEEAGIPTVRGIETELAVETIVNLVEEAA